MPQPPPLAADKARPLIDLMQKERATAADDHSPTSHHVQPMRDAPCLKAATEGALTKREDGIVILDPP